MLVENMKTYIYIILLFCLLGCSNKANNTSSILSEIDTLVVEEDVNIRPEDKHIPIYEEISEYRNNLSEIASEISFVKLSNEPLVRDFFIYDIQSTDQFIFLMGPQLIYQYDWNGNFIRQIGGKGQGPGEYTNLTAPLMIDSENKLLYAHDLHTQQLLVYDFDGVFKKKVNLDRNASCLTMYDSILIAERTSSAYRFLPYEGKAFAFRGYNGKIVKSFGSYLYPISRDGLEHYGPDVNPLWNNDGNFYMLEYGNDTIYQVTKETLIPDLVLTGKLALDRDGLFKKDTKDKVWVGGPLMKPNSYVFESNRFLLFRMYAATEIYYAICDKKTGQISRTGHQDKRYEFDYKGEKSKDYFIDDLVSNMVVDPLYQSSGIAIGLILAPAIVDDRDNITNFIDQHPTDEGTKLKEIVTQMTEEDNSIVCFIKFK